MISPADIPIVVYKFLFIYLFLDHTVKGWTEIKIREKGSPDIETAEWAEHRPRSGGTMMEVPLRLFPGCPRCTEPRR